MKGQHICNHIGKSAQQVLDNPEQCCQKMEENNELGEKNLLMEQKMKMQAFLPTPDDETVHKGNLFGIRKAPLNLPTIQPCPLHPGTKHSWDECSCYESA